MKFPRGGGSLSCELIIKDGNVRNTIPRPREHGFRGETVPYKSKSVAQLELLGNGLIAAEVLDLQIAQQAATLADHHQQPAPGAMIFFVRLQMLG